MKVGFLLVLTTGQWYLSVRARRKQFTADLLLGAGERRGQT